ncbi:MAG: lysophospholipid acyltransferase family protein [Candidatus Cloacimonetes bacterium]|nr:lysophospholipid acyltransferase family protein [Candidatus Cloacimonadota bacterium]
MLTKLLFFLEKHLVCWMILLLGKTLIYREQTPRPATPCIYVFWHRNIIPLMYLYRKQNVAIIVSQSKEGEIIAGPTELLGYKVVRGSSTRRGTEALLQFLKIAGEHSLAVTPDGPLGPREVLKKSILFMAYHTNLPLIPMAVDIDREWLFPTWDLFRVPKPKSIISVSCGEPVFINTKEEIESKMTEFQFEMDRLQYVNRDYRNREIQER